MGALAREGLVHRQPRAKPSDIPPPDRDYLTFAPRGITSTVQQHRVLRFLRLLPYRRSQRRFRSPCVGPMNTALKRLMLSRVTPGVIQSTLTFVRLFRLSLPLPVFKRLFLFSHPRGTPGSSAAVLQSLVMLNTRRSCATQPTYPSPLGHVVSQFLVFRPNMMCTMG